jgi:hypothetical protein
MIATLITALMLYGIIVTVLAIRSRKEADAAVEQALWWEKYSTRDGGIN